VLTLSHLKNFLISIKSLFNKSVQQICIDNAHEFFNHGCSSSFLSSGILNESFCEYTLQQNGIIERKHCHLLEVARALKYQASILEKLWGDYVVTINQMPFHVLNGRTLFQLLIGKCPSIHRFRVLGCLCYVSTVDPRDNVPMPSSVYL